MTDFPRRFLGLGTTRALDRRAYHRGRRTTRLGCENLEGRQLLSGISASLNQSFSPPVLVINGTPTGNDTIHVTESGGQISVAGVSISYRKPVGKGLSIPATEPNVLASSISSIQVIPGAGNDYIRIDSNVMTGTTVYAGNGNDTIIAGGGNENIMAGSGTDTVIAIGGTRTIVSGGSGLDSFWVDSKVQVSNVTAAEQKAHMVHTITSFAPLLTANGHGSYSTVTPPLTLNSPSLPDPISDDVSGTVEKNFSANPLFASGGPTANDVTQVAVADCSFMSAVSGIAAIDPNLIRQSIVALGDGTYVIDYKQLFSGPGGTATDTFVRVNADLPVNSSGQTVYASLGAQNSLWVALMEKAWCFQRPVGGPSTPWYQAHVGHYSMIDGGGPNELFSQLGIPGTGLNPGPNFWNQVVTDVNAGMEVVIGTTGATINDGSKLVSAHDYWVVAYDSVHQQLKIRNPWGGPNAYSWITQSEFLNDIDGGCRRDRLMPETFERVVCGSL